MRLDEEEEAGGPRRQPLYAKRSALEETRRTSLKPSLLWMLLEGVPRAAVRVVRSAGYWVGSVVGGVFRVMDYHSAFWRLEFSSVGRFFLSSFVHWYVYHQQALGNGG
jgi:hypothetical protein